MYSYRRTLHEAFKKWSDVAGLKFREVSTAPQDIEIKFVAGEHGDGAANAFDGPGGSRAGWVGGPGGSRASWVKGPGG